MLTEMDGLEARKQVFIMAATNRPGRRCGCSLTFDQVDASLCTRHNGGLTRMGALVLITDGIGSK